MTEILTIDELAAWLKMSPTSIYSMTRRRGQARMEHPLPVLRINGNVRFRRQDVEQWLEKVAQKNQQ